MQLSMMRGQRLGVVIRSIPSLAMLAIALGDPGQAQAQTYTAFLVFSRMTTKELATCQFKLTRNVLVVDSVPPPTYMFATSMAVVDLHAFYSFQRRGFSYISDYMETANTQPDAFVSPKVTVLTARELRAAIAAVSVLSGVVDGGVDSSAELSFSLLQKSGGTAHCFESLLDAANATLLLSALKVALVANAPAYDALAEVACSNRWLGPTNASLLSSSEVRITVTEPRRNRSAGDERFNGSVTVTNVSSRTLLPPLFLVLGNKDCLVTLLGKSGCTCMIKPSGAPYLILPIGSGLARNTRVTLPLAFENPLGNPIELTYLAPGNLDVSPRVFQGTGER